VTMAAGDVLWSWVRDGHIAWNNASEEGKFSMLLLGLVCFIVVQAMKTQFKNGAVSLIGLRAYNVTIVAMVVACNSGQAYHDATEAPMVFFMEAKTDPVSFFCIWVWKSAVMLFWCGVLGLLAFPTEAEKSDN
jgi:hypothetical protein